MKISSPSRRGPRPQHKGTRTIAFWGTEETLLEIQHRTRLLQRRGRYTQSDVINTALRLLLSRAQNKGTRWLQEQIDSIKEEKGLATRSVDTVFSPDDSLIGDGGLGIRHNSPSQPFTTEGEL